MSIYPVYTATGKQVLKDGKHFADAVDEAAAKAIVGGLVSAQIQPHDKALIRRLSNAFLALELEASPGVTFLEKLANFRQLKPDPKTLAWVESQVGKDNCGN